MKSVIATKQIENCILGLWLMHDVPEEHVQLSSWKREAKCGTVYCFGGWVAVSPEFQEQGVLADEIGAPHLLSADGFQFYDYSPAAVLFGDNAMFASRGHHRLDNDSREERNDRDVVVNRLEAQIVKLSAHDKPSRPRN